MNLKHWLWGVTLLKKLNASQAKTQLRQQLWCWNVQILEISYKTLWKHTHTLVEENDWINSKHKQTVKELGTLELNTKKAEYKSFESEMDFTVLIALSVQNEINFG